MTRTHLGALLVAGSLSIAACGGGDPGAKGSGGSGATGSGGAGAMTSAGGGTTTSGGMSGAGGMTTGTGGGASTTGAGGGNAACLGKPLLDALGKSKLLVGVSTSDDVAAQAPFDLRYLYLAGGVFDGAGPCASCATGCTSNGANCSNAAGCGWWGCWQWDQTPPGDYVRSFVKKNQDTGRIPMITYYEILQASGVSEGEAEVKVAANDAQLMARYFADFRFLLQQIDKATALVHIEPDFWGYAQQTNNDPHAQPAAVASANATDCAGEENSIAGLGRCLVKMTRKYAPSAKVGLHASAWATKIDVYLNKDAGFDVAGEAAKVAKFLAECAPDADFVTVEASDRDAQYYESLGQNRWWDATNATLPNFHQAFTWARSVAETASKPLVWWQLPVGNMSLPGGSKKWKDNRVDYFFSHTAEIVAAHGVAIAFGAGAGDQTDPSTDGGNLVSKVNAYAASGGQPACP
jgi:hypothetical protein